MILVCGSHLCHEEKLNCEFRDISYDIVGTLYSCVVTTLDNLQNNLTIDGYSGDHMTNKNDADVKAITNRNTNTKYIPTNLGSFSNLIALDMDNSQLVEIKAKDFHGMQSLEQISLSDNKLSSVPLDAFATLTKLRFISLRRNQIEELPNDIFKNNLELVGINLYKNRIKYLGTEILNDLKKLNSVDLRYNICVSKYYNGITKITKKKKKIYDQLKEDIKINCTKPNEVPATTTTTTQTPTTTTTTTQTPTTTSTTQNPMEVKLIELQEHIRKLENQLKGANVIQRKKTNYNEFRFS